LKPHLKKMSFDKKNFAKNFAKNSAKNSFASLAVEEIREVKEDIPSRQQPTQFRSQTLSFRKIMAEEQANATMRDAEQKAKAASVRCEDDEYVDREDADSFVQQGGLKSCTAKMSAYNDKLGGAFIAAAKELFPNPEGSKFKTPVKVKYNPKTHEYTIIAYGGTVEKAEAILEKLMREVKLFIANKDTEVEVSRSNPVSFGRFFKGRDEQKLFPYIFTLDERDDGVFIKLFRQGVSAFEFSDAELEFWRIFDYFNSLNDVEEEVNIMKMLRELSPTINETVEQFKAQNRTRHEGAGRPPVNYN